MSPLQKARIEQSKLRERHNVLTGKLNDGDGLEDTERRELDEATSRLIELEPELRALEYAEAQESPEVRSTDPARDELERRAQVSDVLSSVMSGVDPSGATRELQSELGLGGNQVPLSLLGDAPAGVEVRTSGQTPAPSTVGANQHPIIPAVFPRSAATFLGVAQPSVGVGESVYTVLTTNLSPGTPAGGASQGHSAGAFTATSVSPSRIQGSFFIRREDRAKLAGMEQSLRQNLSDAMSDKLDSEVVGANGFLKTGSLAAAPSGDGATEATFATYRGLLYDSGTIDGLYANTAGEVSLLVGAATYAHAAAKYRSNNADDSALDSLASKAGGVRVGYHIPAAASDVQSVLVVKGAPRMHAVAPIWEGIEVIVDEVTQAKSGEIVITAVMLWGGLNVLRSAGFVHRTVKLA